MQEISNLSKYLSPEIWVLFGEPEHRLHGVSLDCFDNFFHKPKILSKLEGFSW